MKNIVILGAGFAGISLAKELGRLTKNDLAVDIHLVNQENYFVFQPMLPEVVSCAIEPAHILNPIRHLCPNVNFHQATIEGIDLESQRVALVGTDSRCPRELSYDHLVINLGLMMNLSAVPGMTEHALPLKTLGDAFHLRNHVLSRLEEANSEPREDIRKTILTFVTIGGGFSGVETMAAVNDMVKAVLPLYPRAQETGAHMILIHSRQGILNELDPELAEFTTKKLEKRGVPLRLHTTVNEITPTRSCCQPGNRSQPEPSFARWEMHLTPSSRTSPFLKTGEEFWWMPHYKSQEPPIFGHWEMPLSYRILSEEGFVPQPPNTP